MSTMMLLALFASQDLPPPCEGVSTYAMVECERKNTAWWDAVLNKEYRRAIAASPKTQAAAIRTAQRAWIRYRNSNCAAYARGEGSIARIEAAACLHQMTRSRAQELAEWNKPG